MHEHHHGHAHDAHPHAHQHDQGFAAALRYLSLAPMMWRSAINDAVVDLVAPTPGERCLDIGAGMGAGTMRAARTGASVVAVEPMPFMRRILALRRLLQRTRGDITLANGAAEHLPVADGSVDAVWAVNTMHHWVNADTAASEIARVLRPGGRVVLVDEDFDDVDHPQHRRFSAGHRRPGAGFECVDAALMGQRLVRAGLVEVDTSLRRLDGRPVVGVTARRPSTNVVHGAPVLAPSTFT